jgi:phosphate transport system protein
MSLPERTRIVFHEELASLERETLETFGMVAEMANRAVESVVNQDVELATFVIGDDDRIDGRYLDVHQGLLNLIALQAPVASDLRIIAAMLHTIMHLERIGDLCTNIAKLVPLSGHEPPTDPLILDIIERMGAQVHSQIDQARIAFEGRDSALAEHLVIQDDLIDQLNREVFQLAIDIGGDPERREWSVYMVLIARYLERIGDHTVDIGEQTAFVVTGEFREFTDASAGRKRARGSYGPAD